MPRTRLVRADDVPRLTELVRTNRLFLAPWEPRREADYFTLTGQRMLVAGALDLFRQGRTVPHVIVDDAGAVVGRVTLTNIVHGAFQSCNLGYWVAQSHNGRGLATEAVASMLEVAFSDVGLHRVEAGTLLHNVASQRVLEHNGFVRFGVAPSYLEIDGRWQDHLLHQALAPGIM
jgi:ribosomal-protein-alanine N-acetyltransferase